MQQLFPQEPGRDGPEAPAGGEKPETLAATPAEKPKIVGPRLGDVTRSLNRLPRLAVLAAVVGSLAFPSAAAAGGIA